MPGVRSVIVEFDIFKHLLSVPLIRYTGIVRRGLLFLRECLPFYSHIGIVIILQVSLLMLGEYVGCV